MDAREEQKLVLRMLAGDEAALTLLMDRYGEGIYNYILYRVGRDADDAEDILQEVLFAAIRSLASFKRESGLYAWLLGLARHKIADHRRVKSRRTELTLDLERETVTDDMLKNEVVTDLVSATMASLPPIYRRALTEKYLEQRSVRELAERLEMSEKAAESILTRSRALFKRTFEDMVREERQ